MISKGAAGFSDFKGKGFFRLLARAIKFFTRRKEHEGIRKWSHSFYIINEHENPEKWLVQEAGVFGVYIVSFKKYLRGKYAVELYLPLVEDEVLDESIDKGFDDLEIVYGYLQMLGFIPVWLVRVVFGKHIKNPFGGGIICSESLLSHLKRIKVDPRFDEMDDNTTDPNLIYPVVLKSKFKKVTIEA